MEEIFEGRAHVFGDNIDTDIIIPSMYLVSADETELGRHAFGTFMPSFSESVQHGDILVAGRNFGCGSSREHAPLAIRGAGISCIIAESFARTFYRNCINRGFPVIELKNASSVIHDGDSLTVDFDSSVVINNTSGKGYEYIPFPDFVKDIWRYGGLLGYIQSQLNK